GVRLLDEGTRERPWVAGASLVYPAPWYELDEGPRARGPRRAETPPTALMPSVRSTPGAPAEWVVERAAPAGGATSPTTAPESSIASPVAPAESRGTER